MKLNAAKRKWCQMANLKPKLKYRVVKGYNPLTRGTCMRPQITDRETYYLDHLVKFALDNGFVRGKFHDMKGALNGFIECIQYLSLNGKAVSLNDWLRVHAELTGTVGEGMQLTDENELRVRIQALKELKTSIDNFSWTNVSETGNMPKIDAPMYVGARAAGEIKKSEAIIATGRNLVFNSELGDSVTVSWLDSEETKSATIIPVESDYSHMKFEWPDALSEVPDGSEITFTFHLHGGIEGGAAYDATKSVILLASA